MLKRRGLRRVLKCRRLQRAHQAGPRGATPRPRSGAEAGRTPCPKGGGQKELPHIWGQGQRPRMPDCDGAGIAERSYPTYEVRGAAERRYTASEVRGGRWEELLHAPTPKARGSSWEEQPHARGQGRWLGGPTPHRGCTGTGGPRGAIPHWRSGRAVVRRYPSSKVRSIGCTLLEQPWRDAPHPR